MHAGCLLGNESRWMKLDGQSSVSSRRGIATKWLESSSSSNQRWDQKLPLDRLKDHREVFEVKSRDNLLRTLKLQEFFQIQDDWTKPVVKLYLRTLESAIKRIPMETREIFRTYKSLREWRFSRTWHLALRRFPVSARSFRFLIISLSRGVL